MVHKRESFLPVIGNEIKLSTTATLFNYTEGFSHYSKIKVTNKSENIRKGEIKLPIFTDNMIDWRNKN